MKKITFILCCVLLSSNLLGQKSIELQTNPLVILIPEVLLLPISVEFITNDSWTTELDLLIGASDGNFAVLAYGAGKHYFNPRVGADRFYAGMFVGGGSLGEDINGGGLGFFIGNKWVSNKNIVFDIGLGIGRDFIGNMGVLPYGKLHVGYRFGSKNKE